MLGEELPEDGTMTSGFVSAVVESYTANVLAFPVPRP
jgi:hypothetical protein